MTKEDIEEAVGNAFKYHFEHKCRFPFNDEQVQETGHIMGMAKDIGGGDLSLGIEEMRTNHKFMKTIRRRSDKIGMIVMGVIVTIITGGAIKALWEGAKHFAQK